MKAGKQSRSYTSGKTHSAFTLIELILAVGVAALVLAAINGVFFSALRLQERTTEAVNAALPLDQALTILRRDLQGALPPATNGLFLGSFKAGPVSSTDLNQPVDLELHTTTGSLRVAEPWGDVQRVSYSLRPSTDSSAPGKELIRTVTRNLLSTLTPSPSEQRLIGGVQNIQFSCYDGVEWRDFWDTTLGDTNLPAALRVRIELADANTTGHIVQMVVPIVSKPPATAD